MANREQCEKYPVIGECFEEYTRRRVSMLAPFMDAGMNMMRVIPVQAAIENNSRRASYDEVHRLVENAWAISVGACSCRRSRRLMGEGCGHLEEDMCIYLNDNAINYSKMGEHRLIDKEEAYEILRRAERNGLVHELNVAPGYEDCTAICNCCGCSCYALRIATYFRAPDAVKSNYVARVDKDKCVACGECVENCQVNAVKLGSKLCPVDTTIPRPDETARNTLLWGSKNYNPDFRLNRTDVTESGTAPCKSACPAHVSVQGYIALAKQGRYLDALRLIKKDNPFPALCGSICNKPCEAACMRGEIDDPVAIDDLKKFIAEQDLKAGQRWIPPMKNPRGLPYEEKIAVIGGGPAGLSCAYYLREKGYPVTVFEKEKVLGGMPAFAIPAFRMDKKVLQSEIDVLREMGVEFKTGVEVGKDVTLDALRAEGYKAFFLGVGAGKPGVLDCPGADGRNVCAALDMLKKVNLEHRPDLGDDVVIVAGGISTNFITLDAARTVAALGADRVTVLVPRKPGTQSNVKAGVEKAKEKGVKFLYQAEIRAITPESVVYVQDGEEHTIPASAVVAALDRTVDLGGISVKLNAKGTVEADRETCRTSVPDVFAGGDVVTGPRYAINAIAAGKQAAISIHRFVHQGQDLVLGRDRMDYRGLNRKEAFIAPDAVDPAPRQCAKPVNPGRGKNAAFRDVRGVLTPEQVKTEAGRCLGCGVAMVDEYMCVGCAICTTHCKFGAISMEKISDADNREYFRTLGRIATNMPNKLATVAVKHIGKFAK